MRTNAEQAWPVASQAGAGMGWRDLVQSFTHDVADMPILTRLLAGQAVLALGCVTLWGMLALREHAPQSRLMPIMLLGSATAAAGGAFLWGSLALVARIRSVPAATALFMYGQALSQYYPIRRSLASAA